MMAKANRKFYREAFAENFLGSIEIRAEGFQAVAQNSSKTESLDKLPVFAKVGKKFYGWIKSALDASLKAKKQYLELYSWAWYICSHIGEALSGYISFSFIK